MDMFNSRSDVLARKLLELEDRQRELERIVETLAAQASGSLKEAVDQALSSLGSRVNGTLPNTGYFNTRFRNYELAVLNIKQLGYEFARVLAQTNLSRTVTKAPDTVLKSSLCTQDDVESDWFSFWCRELKAAPIYHRKLWELCYICQVLWRAEMLAPTKRGIAFGCGREPLPSLFAKYGAQILATDLDPENPEAKTWSRTGQHAAAVESVRHRDICPDEELLQKIDFSIVDMNNIPTDLSGQFDFCWSACSLEHLGSLANGLNFIENSLRTLKPGGVAVHTTEFNLEDGDTLDHWNPVLYQKKHFIEFADYLTSKGHIVAPLDFNPGSKILDGLVDVPPWSPTYFAFQGNYAHLKLSSDGFPTTSIGFVVTTHR